MIRYLHRALAIAVPALLLATTASGQAQVAPAPQPASAWAPGQGDAYLDELMGKTFFTTFLKAKITRNEKDEWRLQGPEGGVSYVARNPAGGYSFWVTSPIGMRFDATGTIGGRGLGICFKSYCTYWLTAADGAPYYVQTQHKKDGTTKLWGFQAMVEDGTAAAVEAAALWKKRDTNPAMQIVRKKAKPEDYLGFPIEQIEAWIAGEGIDRPATPATTTLAAASTGTPAPISTPAALTPADKFGALVYLVGHDWLITETCNGTATKEVMRANWVGAPGSTFQQQYADGGVSVWRVGKQAATLERKGKYGNGIWQVEPAAVFRQGVRIEAANGRIVGSGTCSIEYAQLQDGTFDDARAENIRLAAEERANRPKKKGGLFKAITKTILFPAKVALVIGEAMVANPGAFASAYQSASANTYQPSTPSDWAARINASPAAVGDMGGVYHVQATKMTPEQQAKADELERFKMREQMARGEKPTSFAQDAYARADADQARRAAEERARPRPTQMASNDNGSAAMDEAERKAEADRKAEEARKADEARRAEEAAKAEKLRKEKLAAEEAARKKREEEERIANAPVEWKEGVVLCEPARAPSRDATCHGPLQTTYGALGEQSGITALQWACGGDTPVRELGQAGGYLAFGCGWGIHPLRPNSDVAARLGISFVPGRRTYHCPKKQTSVCTTN